MAPGQACWTYRGAATTFIGDLGHGQTVAVQMMGQAAEYDPRSGHVATFWRPRDPNVEGPGGFFFGDAEASGVLTLRAPANGTYRFSFSPCAMWGRRAPSRFASRSVHGERDPRSRCAMTRVFGSLTSANLSQTLAARPCDEAGEPIDLQHNLARLENDGRRINRGRTNVGA
jgi:hypothetical protein